MARKIRFPLRMKNGTEVRTLDELKENFDLESVLGYFTDGKLQTWLADRYYDEKAEAVAGLSADTPDLNAKLCEILEVEYKAEADETDLEYIRRRNEKLKILGAVTADQDILKNIDLVAMDQDELYDILYESPENVYLYGEKFEIPFGRKNICYLGINMPLVILENNKYIYNYEDAGIVFRNVKYEGNVNPYITKGEKLFLEGKKKEAFPLIEKAANNGNPRAMYIMALYCLYGYEVIKCNYTERSNWCRRAYVYKEPLSMYEYAISCANRESEEDKRIYSQIFTVIKEMAETGDIMAQTILGDMYYCERGVTEDKSEAGKWYHIPAEQGYDVAQIGLGKICSDYKEYDEGNKLFHKAAAQGNAIAMFLLGTNYDWIIEDKSKAIEWYRKAAAQDEIYSIGCLKGMGVSL